MHHGRLGQQWGVQNGPPYPLGTSNKDYKRKQSVNNGLAKVKQFLYDRFSEYGKDHQAVRDKYIAEYKRKGYNDTAAQILTEQRYSREDAAFAKVAIGAAFVLSLGTLGTMSAAKVIADAGGIAAIKATIKKTFSSLLNGVMSNVDVSSIANISSQITPEMIAEAAKAMKT